MVVSSVFKSVCTENPNRSILGQFSLNVTQRSADNVKLANVKVLCNNIKSEHLLEQLIAMIAIGIEPLTWAWPSHFKILHQSFSCDGQGAVRQTVLHRYRSC